jgi:hypothetical protein
MAVTRTKNQHQGMAKKRMDDSDYSDDDDGGTACGTTSMIRRSNRCCMTTMRRRQRTEARRTKSPLMKSGRANVEIDTIVHLVENIVADKKESGQMRQYLIKYKDLSNHYAKWIPEEDLINVLSFQCY